MYVNGYFCEATTRALHLQRCARNRNSTIRYDNGRDIKEGQAD